MLDVQWTQLNRFPDRNSAGSSSQSVEAIPPEGILIVMHNAVVVVADSQIICDGRINFLKVVPEFWADIVVQNIDVVISIRPAMLVPEPKQVAHFMQDDWKHQAGCGKGNPLFAVTKLTDI